MGTCALRFLKQLLQTAIGVSIPSYSPTPSGHLSPADAAVEGGLNCGALPPSVERVRNMPRLLTAAAATFMGSDAAAEADAHMDPSLYREGNVSDADLDPSLYRVGNGNEPESASDVRDEGEGGGGGNFWG